MTDTSSKNKPLYNETTLNWGEDNYATVEYGKKKSNTLLALHGFITENAFSYSNILPLLKDDFFCLAPEWPGHGNSAYRSIDMPHRHTDYVYDALKIINSLDKEKVSIIGHCMGADVAAIVASVVPERISKIVLIEAPLNGGPEYYRSITERVREATERNRSLLESLEFNDVDDIINYYFDFFMLDFEEYGSFFKEWAIRNFQSFKGRLRQNLDKRRLAPSPFGMSKNTLNEILENIKCPVLSLVGAKSHMKFDNKEQLKKIKALTEIKVDGPHHLHLTNASEVAKIVKDFLNKN